MKEGIHPEYLPAHVSCACGAKYDTHSTRGDFSVEVCANCHPFYTGKQKLMDTKGRVDRFRRRYSGNAAVAAATSAAEAASTEAASTASEAAPSASAPEEKA